MKKVVGRLLKYGTILSTYGFIGAVVIQVYSRFLMDSAPSWTEEASRFFFIYAIAFASGLALKSKYYVALDVIEERLSPRVNRYLEFISLSLVIGLFALIGWHSIPMIIQAHAETSPSMRINMSFAFVSMLLMSASIVFFGVLELLNTKKEV